MGNVTLATIIRRHHLWKPIRNPASPLLRTTSDLPKTTTHMSRVEGSSGETVMVGEQEKDKGPQGGGDH